MDIQEKEIDLLEEHFKQNRTVGSKLDMRSLSLFLLSFIIYTTIDLTLSIKLALIGFELNNLHAVYVLYILSLFSWKNFCVHSVKEKLLIERYRYLLKKVYGSIPESTFLIEINEFKLRSLVFTGTLWVRINHILVYALAVPFVFSYLWLTYELIRFESTANSIKVASFFIVILFLTSIILFFKDIMLGHEIEKAHDNI